MSRLSAPRLVVAINPAACFGKNAGVGALVLTLLREAGFQVEGIQASSYDVLREDLRGILDTTVTALVVVGGDGMVHLGAELCGQYDLPLGIIPSGTDNDLARHLGIPLTDPSAAVAMFIDALAAGPQAIDLGVVVGESGTSAAFACVLSAGFDAIVNERANRLRFPKGRHRYTLALLIELMKLRPLSYAMEVDGVKETGKYLLVAVANSQSFGGGMKVAPNASLIDGLLDVFTLTPLSRLAFLRIYPRVFRGTHVSDPRVTIRQARRVRIACEGVVAYADGEAVGCLPLEVGVSPQALRVFAPTFGATR